MGGVLTVTNVEEGGTALTVSIPVASGNQDAFR
jgi:hypothetical protein